MHAPPQLDFASLPRTRSLRPWGAMRAWLWLWVTALFCALAPVAFVVLVAATLYFALLGLRDWGVEVVTHLRLRWAELGWLLLMAAQFVFGLLVARQLFGRRHPERAWLPVLPLDQKRVHALVAWVSALEVSRWVILAMILFGYLVLGCLMDQVAILILTVPIVLPVVKALGFDPVWFGVVVILMAEVGLVTPPIGLNVFVVARYARRPLAEIFGGVWPHVFSHLLLVVVLVAFPQIILWLPSQMTP